MPTSPLPNDIASLHALILAERATTVRLKAENERLNGEAVRLNGETVRLEAERQRLDREGQVKSAEVDRLTAQNERLDHIISVLRRAQFGRKSERLDPDQVELALEDVQTAMAAEDAAVEKAQPTLKASATKARRVNRGALPQHLPREEIVIAPETTSCPCCGGALHVIGEDTSERLDKVPAKLRVIVTRRPKYACRTCEKTGSDDTVGVIQAPAPNRLITGGLPTEALVADVLVSKYADHLPLYRQSQILAREGITIDRSTLAHWVGFAAFELEPVHARLVAIMKTSGKLFADETRCPVLDPGRGKNQNRLPVDHRPRRPTLGWHRPASSGLSLCDWPGCRTRHPPPRGLWRRAAGRWLCRL